MEISFGNAQIAILFAILFIVVGYVAPIMYASYAPQDHYITVNEFSAQDAATTDDSHLVCFDRMVQNSQSGTVFTELYLVNGNDDTRVKVDSRTMERYFQDGEIAVESRFPLPEDLKTGDYRYILVVEMDLAQGRVSREFEFMSQSFTISQAENETVDSTTDSFSC